MLNDLFINMLREYFESPLRIFIHDNLQPFLEITRHLTHQ